MRQTKKRIIGMRVNPPLPPIQARCQWFLRCENPATTYRAHPVLGDVPICDRCNEKCRSIEEKTK